MSGKHPGSDAAAHWKFQTVEGDVVHLGNPTEARGLRLRDESGYGWVVADVCDDCGEASDDQKRDRERRLRRMAEREEI